MVDNETCTGNIFNLPVPDGGNRWDDFDTIPDGCYDDNLDDFCDAPYVFEGGQDELPLIDLKEDFDDDGRGRFDNCPRNPNYSDQGTCTSGLVGRLCDNSLVLCDSCPLFLSVCLANCVGNRTCFNICNSQYDDCISDCDIGCGPDGFCSMAGEDQDGDGVGDACDNCPDRENSDQADTDEDGMGDICDSFPNDAANDSDGDGYSGNLDNCPLAPNSSQTDTDNDGIGDACDICIDVPNTQQADDDNDYVGNVCDNCPGIANNDQADTDGDGVGDACDICIDVPNTQQEDVDNDSVGNVCDNCPDTANPDQADIDADGIGDVCDNCLDNANTEQTDIDGDGIGNSCDNCDAVPNPNQLDADNDNIGDLCDSSPGCGGCGKPDCDIPSDVDNDGVPDSEDNCPLNCNTQQLDADNDGTGDVCDGSPGCGGGSCGSSEPDCEIEC